MSARDVRDASWDVVSKCFFYLFRRRWIEGRDVPIRKGVMAIANRHSSGWINLERLIFFLGCCISDTCWFHKSSPRFGDPFDIVLTCEDVNMLFDCGCPNRPVRQTSSCHVRILLSINFDLR